MVSYLDAFVNETKEDYEVNVVFNVLGPSTDSKDAVTELNIECTFTLHGDADEEVGKVTLKLKKPSIGHKVTNTRNFSNIYEESSNVL